MTKKHNLTKLKLSELSLVDKGANQHAQVTIFKRAPDHDALAETITKFYGDEKQVSAKDFKELLAATESRSKLWEVREELSPLFDALTQSINTIITDETVSMAEKMPRIERNVNDFLVSFRDKMPTVEDDLVKFFNDISIATKKDNLNMAEKETVTVESLQKSLDEANATLEAVNKKLEASEIVAKMSDDEKAYMAKMSDDDKAAFMAMSAADRAKKMQNVKKNDETVKVGDTVISKSVVGDEQFAIFKMQAEQIAKAEERIAKAEEKAAMTAFEKRASNELDKLPGTDIEKAHVLKAVASLTDEVAKNAIETILKAANEANAPMFETIGKKSGEVEKNAMKAYEDGISEIMKRDSVSKSKAMETLAAEKPEVIEAIR